MLGMIPDGEYDFIGRSLQRGQLTGSEAVIDEVEQMIGRRIEHRAPGNQPTKGDSNKTSLLATKRDRQVLVVATL